MHPYCSSDLDQELASRDIYSQEELSCGWTLDTEGGLESLRNRFYGWSWNEEPDILYCNSERIYVLFKEMESEPIERISEGDIPAATTAL
jgi:hypothetical protein